MAVSKWTIPVSALLQAELTGEALRHTKRRSSATSFRNKLTYTGFVLLSVAVGAVAGQAWLRLAL